VQITEAKQWPLAARIGLWVVFFSACGWLFALGILGMLVKS
jgi:hypothetical protein